MKTFGIIVAGGAGTRMGGNIPKQYMDVNGKPLLYYTLKAFEESDVTDVSVVVAKEYLQFVLTEIIDRYGFKKVIRVCEGGKERLDSSFHALDDLSDVAAEDDIVLIHDGARPFVRAEFINKMIVAVKDHGAAIAGMPVKDTIKIADADGFVAETTQRALTWQIQTPQGFHYGDILQAYRIFSRNRMRKMATDDSMVYEAVFPEKKVKLVEASYDNIKITTPDDLEVAKSKLK
ncbi:MAG: 2-C-methyl-D-erythritol 4-phosphate cytidylyltransferase [Lachnospiraceae bacterium]|nr:2-C-methyl-D-erythritol 4-phosphate cytidylyltransferase [Lachnospiraceae bacterium]